MSEFSELEQSYGVSIGSPIKYLNVPRSKIVNLFKKEHMRQKLNVYAKKI